MAREWVQSQSGRLELKTINQEKSFFWNTSQTALKVIELALDERCLKSLDLLLNSICRSFLLLDGIEKAIGLIQFSMVVYSRIFGQELRKDIHLYRGYSSSTELAIHLEI